MLVRRSLGTPIFRNTKLREGGIKVAFPPCSLLALVVHLVPCYLVFGIRVFLSKCSPWRDLPTHSGNTTDSPCTDLNGRQRVSFEPHHVSEYSILSAAEPKPKPEWHIGKLVP